MRKTICIILCLWVIILSAEAQITGPAGPHCGSDEIWADMVRRDSSLFARRYSIDSAISVLSNSTHHASGQRGLTTPPATVIPTVIYDVYDNGGAYLSMTQIQSQMDKLNLDFAPYGFIFCYAQRNVLDTSFFAPQGGDSAGVFRYFSALSQDSMYTNDAQLKSLCTLPAANYLRIFIVHTITPADVLAYTILTPGSGAADGIVIRADVFGSNDLCPSCTLYPRYNEGATLTHEVGHYLSLYHTFQGGCDTGTTFQACQLNGDWVCDTPPTTGSFGCPGTAPFSCDGVHRELINNYMDYTDDPCKNAFTAGQNSRMNQSLTAYHPHLVSTQNLINTGVTCVDLTSHFADFDCDNFNGCVGRAMTFAPVTQPGVAYTWTFGDGATGTGDIASHTYAAVGQYQVTLTAVDTTQGINVAHTMPVFITQCAPILCPTNKLDFEFGYMDFSSGTPLPVSHPSACSNPPFGDFFGVYYRADDAGHPLFHLGGRNCNAGYRPCLLVDSAFNIVDSLALQSTPGSNVLVPVPGKSNTYCHVASWSLDSAEVVNSINKLYYTIVDAHTGHVFIPPAKKLVPVAIPATTTHSIFYQMTAIPGCDGTRIWIVVNYFNSHYSVFQLDSTETLTLHQSYTTPDSSLSPAQIVSAPNGRKIAVPWSQYGVNLGMYVLDFDKATGNITGFNNLYTISPPYIDDVLEDRPCFSPDSRFLYESGICCQQASGNIVNYYQYDLCSPDPMGSKRTIFSYPVDDAYHYPIQWSYIGPDEKLYVGHITVPGNDPSAYRLSVINNPNTLENGTNSTGFNQNGPYIVPANCPYPFAVGLVGFSGISDQNDALSCDWQSSVPRIFSYCPTSCLSYQFHGDECFASHWHFGDPGSGASDSSALAEPVHVFSHSGRYVVRMTAGTYTFTDTVNVSNPAVQIAATTIDPCPTPHSNYSIAAAQPGILYNWTITHGTPSYASGRTDVDVQWNTADTTGTIIVVAIDTMLGCTDTARLTVHYRLSDSTSVNYTNGTVCAGSVYHFHNQSLTAAGTYSDTTVVPGGCKIITLLTLKASHPVASWSCDTVAHSGGPVLLTGGIPAGGVYSGVGVYGGAFYPDSAVGSSTITYTYTDSSGCSASTSCTYIVTGLSDLDMDERITLYPNPASGQLIARYDMALPAPVQIQMYDMTGRLISAPMVEQADRSVFDISSLTEGIYFIKFSYGGREIRKRFVKIN